MSTTQTNEATAETEPRTTWYFTFGSGQFHPTTGEDLYGAYVVIVGTRAEARDKMVAAFGNAWSFQYETAGSAGVALFAMRQLEMPEPIQPRPVDLVDERGDAEQTAIVEEGAAVGAELGFRDRELEAEAAAEVAAEIEPETVDADVMAAREPTQAQQLAAGFRALADMFDANPDLADVDYCFSYIFAAINIPLDDREQIATLARAGMRAGGKVDKHQNDTYAGVNVRFGRVGLHLYADRNAVCERIVTGTREVTKEVPDPEALKAVPTVTVTEVVEDVEWRCLPILAEPAEIAAPTPAEVAV